ncbi:hypothetical protein HC024_05865 [Methylococcaceae bacterium WWC4]|nr:hypothetical protein [Methylococcaceae bacterium WWC4]
MAKSDYLPRSDGELLLWHDRFKDNLIALKEKLGLSDDDIAVIVNDNEALHSKIAASNISAAAAQHANAEKTAACIQSGGHTRILARRIKTLSNYTQAIGNLLGIIGSESSQDLSEAKPVLKAIDQTGGVVEFSFLKGGSDGINLYCQRDNDAEFMFLARETQTHFIDNRPLLVPGKPELRRYTAVYVQKDHEVGQFSDELVVNCAP